MQQSTHDSTPCPDQNPRIFPGIQKLLDSIEDNVSTEVMVDYNDLNAVRAGAKCLEVDLVQSINDEVLALAEKRSGIESDNHTLFRKLGVLRLVAPKKFIMEALNDDRIKHVRHPIERPDGSIPTEEEQKQMMDEFYDELGS